MIRRRVHKAEEGGKEGDEGRRKEKEEVDHCRISDRFWVELRVRELERDLL